MAAVWHGFPIYLHLCVLLLWQAVVSNNWTALTDSEKASLMGHIRGCDWPESLVDYEAIASAAGFSRVQCLWSAPQHNFKLVCFER